MTGEPSVDVRQPEHRSVDRHGGAVLMLVGGIAGVAWAASLRALMTEIAGYESNFSWSGTFGWILLPGALVGALLGWAEHIRRTGGRRRWRWLAAAPLLFAAILFLHPLDLPNVLEDGVGLSAIAIPAICMLGGYALSRRGPVWGRVAAGAVFLAALVAWALTVESLGGADFALTTPHGAWATVLCYSLLLELAMASSIPHRRVVDHRSAPEHSSRSLTP